MAEQNSIQLNFGDIKPIFADEVALAAQVKASKGDKGSIEKEGIVRLIFVDAMKHQSVGEFVISRNTARGLAKALQETMANIEKQLADKSMPKQPEIKTTSDSMYR